VGDKELEGSFFGGILKVGSWKELGLTLNLLKRVAVSWK